MAIPVTGRGGLYGCETSRLPYSPDNRLRDGGKVVGPTHRPRSTPQKHYLSASGTRFCYRLSMPQSLVLLEGLDKLKRTVLTSSCPEPPIVWLVA
jgi:hypothetical protein